MRAVIDERRLLICAPSRDIYMTARLISDRDLQLLRRYDKKDADRKSVV